MNTDPFPDTNVVGISKFDVCSGFEWIAGKHNRGTEVMRKRRRKTQVDTRALERELTSLERNLLEALRSRLDQIRSGTAGRSAEFMDIVSSNELDELTARIAESDSTKIDEVEMALRRLREGEYGICSDCGGAISKKRLKARPFATLCIGCKLKAERENPAHAEREGHHSSFGGNVDLGVGKNEDAGFELRETVRGNKF